MVGRTGVGGNEKEVSNPAKHHWTNHREMIKLQKENCVNYFAGVLLNRLSPNSGAGFF